MTSKDIWHHILLSKNSKIKIFCVWAHEGAQSHKLAFAHRLFILGVNYWKTPIFRLLTTIETIRGQLRNLDHCSITFGSLPCENFGSIRPISQTDFTPWEQGSNESCHNLNHYFKCALCCIMLSQLGYIVLCPVILCAYFGRSHYNTYQVIVTEKYSVIAFRPFWHNIDVTLSWTWRIA